MHFDWQPSGHRQPQPDEPNGLTLSNALVSGEIWRREDALNALLISALVLWFLFIKIFGFIVFRHGGASAHREGTRSHPEWANS